MKTYFIDESWNSGDLIMKEDNKNFNAQPLFGLCAIGYEENKKDLVENKINDLKKKYKIQSKDLKIKSIYKKKLGFLLELFNFLEKQDAIFLIEIIDKKYQIAINIVDHLIYPSYYTLYSSKIQIIKNYIVTYIYNKISDKFFINFSNVSRDPNENDLFKLWSELKQELVKLNDNLANLIILHIKESIDDFKLMKENKNSYERPIYTYFLPLPDKNKRGENLVMLPYINCFSNILARINNIEENLNQLAINFDEQAYFDEILEEYKIILEDNQYYLPEMNINSFSNFSFKSKIKKFNFQNSKNSIGIQISDLFAGFTCRSIFNFYQNNLCNEELLLLSLLIEKNSINLVAPIDLQQKIFSSIEFYSLLKKKNLN